MSSATRGDLNRFLVGQISSSLPPTQLSTRRDILKYLLYKKNKAQKESTSKQTPQLSLQVCCSLKTGTKEASCGEENGLSFDTTAVNTGQWKGACVRLEEEMGMKMLWLPCRHHVAEVVIKTVSVEVGRPTKGDEDILFKRFRDEGWNLLLKDGVDMEKLVKLDRDNVSALVGSAAEETLSYLLKLLQDDTFPRGDYKELCQLAALYLGGDLSISFQTPGPVHHARFMSRCIYYLKMGMVQRQTDIFHQKEIREINVMSEFVAVFFSLWRFKSMPCAEAPKEDLNFIAQMRKYKCINPEVADPALRSLERHQWYLTQVIGSLKIHPLFKH